MTVLRFDHVRRFRGLAILPVLVSLTGVIPGAEASFIRVLPVTSVTDGLKPSLDAECAETDAEYIPS